MIAPGVTTTIWNGRIDAERHQRCYAEIAARNHQLHTWLMGAIAVGSGLTASDLLIGFAPPLVTAILATAVGLTSIVALTFRFSVTAARAEAASRHYGQLVTEWNALWWNQYDAGVLDTARELATRMWVVDVSGITVSKKLNLKCAEEAHVMAQADFQSA